MNARKMGRLLSLTAGIAAASMTGAFAGASATAKAAPTKTTAPVAAVVVKLGDAMLEEYHDGDPAGRTTVLRGGDVAQKPKNAEGGKKRS